VRLLLAFALNSDSCCIDVGAHEGIWLEQFRRLAPRGRHIAYEPLPQMYEALAEKYPEMDVRNAALSNAAGEASFVHVTDHPGYSGLGDGPFDLAEFERRYDTAEQWNWVARA
jgi:FkbM family methyltransferase